MKPSKSMHSTASNLKKIVDTSRGDAVFSDQILLECFEMVGTLGDVIIYYKFHDKLGKVNYEVSLFSTDDSFDYCRSTDPSLARAAFSVIREYVSRSSHFKPVSPSFS